MFILCHRIVILLISIWFFTQLGFAKPIADHVHPILPSPAASDDRPLVLNKQIPRETVDHTPLGPTKKNTSPITPPDTLKPMTLKGQYLQTTAAKTRVFVEPRTNSAIVNYLPPQQLLKIIGKTRYFYICKLYTDENRYILKKDVRTHYFSKKKVYPIVYKTVFKNEINAMGTIAKARADRYFPVTAQSTTKQIQKNINTALLYWDQYWIDFFVIEKGWKIQALL